MPTPTEHKTVQARILEYAEAIGWTIVPRDEAEQRRDFDSGASSKERAKGTMLFFDNLLDVKMREFNPFNTVPNSEPAKLAASTPTSTATRNSSITCVTGLCNYGTP